MLTSFLDRLRIEGEGEHPVYQHTPLDAVGLLLTFGGVGVSSVTSEDDALVLHHVVTRDALSDLCKKSCDQRQY